MYTDSNLGGGPVSGSWHHYKAECLTCQNQVWALYIDGLYKSQLATGWSNGRANMLDAGGEVGGHATGIGMEGNVNQMQYKRASTWYYATQWEQDICSYGYWLQYTTPDHNNIADGGYSPGYWC